MQYLICQEKKKYPANSPQYIYIYIYIYIFYKKKKKKNTRKQNMQYGNDIICKARSNL
jgi:hypothetical protein